MILHRLRPIRARPRAHPRAHLRARPCRAALYALALGGMLSLTACQNIDRFDHTGNLDREDYEALHDRAPKAGEAAKIPPPLPNAALLPILPPPAADAPREPRVTLSVADAVPVKDVLVDLAREAGYGLALDPTIHGTVFLQARNEPFPSVIGRLCDLAALRCTLEKNMLRVEADRPYLQTYAFDYVNLNRRARSEIGIATNVFTAVRGQNSNTSSGGGSGSTALGGIDTESGNNSVTLVEGDAVSNVWSEISATLSGILGVPETTAGQIAATAVATSAPAASTAGESQISALTNAAAKNSSAAAVTPAPEVSFSLNRQAGIISVVASIRQHKEINEYLEQLRRRSGAQVLIEARIVEVDLNERYRSGIDWQTLFGGAVEAGLNFTTPTNIATATDGLFSLTVDDSDVNGIIQLVRGFGATRTLSSPRLTVLNNQTAVLKVARNHVYFTSTVEQTQVVTNSGTTSLANPLISSTPNTVPIGLVMSVQPAIDLDQDNITLNLRPTISRLVDEVRDPSVDLASSQVCGNLPSTTCARVSSLIPVIEVREMDSVLRLKSGAVAILGGLMQDRADNQENGLPGLDRVPVVGNLAKSRDSDSGVTELVILLRATITDQALPDAADASLYRKYHKDPRPLPVGSSPALAAPSAQN